MVLAIKYSRLTNSNMKKFLIIFILLLLTGCGGNQVENLIKDNSKVEAATTAINKNQDKIEDKGKAFVFGAGYANQQETNRTPAIEVSSRFIDLAQLTLGNPSVNDAMVIKEITDGLLLEYKLKLAQTESEAKSYKKQIELAEIKLDNFSKEIVLLQTKEQSLKEKYEKEIKERENKNLENAQKAEKWDAANQWWNPFTDLARALKKIAVLGLIGGVLVVLFQVGGTALGIGPITSAIAGVFGGIIKLLFRFIPMAKKYAGVVGSSVFSALKTTTQVLQTTFNRLKNEDLESELLTPYPSDKLFTKEEVKGLLESHSLKIESLIKTELDKVGNDETRGVIMKTKEEIGLKPKTDNINF